MNLYKIISVPLFFTFLIFMACNEAPIVNNPSTENEGAQITYDSATFFQNINRKVEKFRRQGGVFNVIGEFTIDIGNDYLAHYEIYHYAERAGEKILTGYNNTRHSLEFINLKTQKIYASIPFVSEGPNGIRNVTGIFYHNQDSIFLISDFHFLLLNEKGDIKLNYKINQPDANEFEGIDFSRLNFSPWKEKSIYYYAPQKALIVPTHSVQYSQWTIPQYFEANVCAKISLENKKVELLPLYYPDEYRKYRFGFSNKSFFAYNDEQVVVGFTNSPRLFSYNLETKEVSTHNCKSKFYQKMLPYSGINGDDQAMLNHMNKYTQYLNLYYNSEKQRYYLKSGFQEDDFPGIKFNLTIINTEFETLCELTLPPSLPPIGMFSTANGLAFRDYQKSNNKQSIYQIVDIDCK